MLDNGQSPPVQLPRPPKPSPDTTLAKIWKAITKAYADTASWGSDAAQTTADWGKDKLAAATSDECLLGAIHQYRMWNLSFNATYALFETQSPRYIDSQGDIHKQQPTPIMISPLIDKSFTTDSEKERVYIRNALDMSTWAVRADITERQLYMGTMDGITNGHDIQHTSLVGAIKACKEEMDKVDSSQLGYTNGGLIMGIGMLMLQTPNALDANDLEELIQDVDKKLDALQRLLYALRLVPSNNDEEISQLLEKFMGMQLDDYVDNILTGNIFGLGETSNHVAALANMVVMAEGLLAPCLDMLKATRGSMASLNGSMAAGMAGLGKVVATIMAYIELTTKSIAQAAMVIGLTAIGGSMAIVNSIMGLKMQIQELQKKAEAATRGISVGLVMAPPDLGECPLTALINLENIIMAGEATAKNAIMMPLIKIADQILKPILESISDIGGDIQSMASMLGQSLASAYNMISVQRWVDYALVYQLNQMRDKVSLQISFYQELKSALTSFKNKIKPQKDIYAMIDRAFKSYVRRIAQVAQEHDSQVEEGKNSYDKAMEAQKLLRAVMDLLLKRTADDSDKDELMSTMQRFDAIVERDKENLKKARENIREAGKNLAGLWSEITEMRKNDTEARELMEYTDALRVYASIFKIIFGADLNDLIDELNKVFWDIYGPRPEPEPGSDRQQTPRYTNKDAR